MAEFGGDFPYRRRSSITTIIGTQSGTILGPVPPQYSEEITEVVVTAYGGGTVSGRLMQFATLQGYTNQGTVAGTIVEPFQVTAYGPFIDGNGAAPVAYVDPGCLLYGQTDYGSALVKVVHRPIYRR